MATDTTLMRETVFADRTVFEVIHPLVLDHMAMGVLRIGLSMDEVRAAEDRMQRRMIVISFVLILLATACHDDDHRQPELPARSSANCNAPKSSPPSANSPPAWRTRSAIR